MGLRSLLRAAWYQNLRCMFAVQMCTPDCACSYFTVKPSKPFCKVEGTPEKGHLIYLLCNCEEGLPRPTYRWYKVDGNALKPVTEQLGM